MNACSRVSRSFRFREWPTTSRINLSTLLAATGSPDAVRCTAKGAKLQMPSADRAYIRLSRRSNVVQMRQRYQGTLRKGRRTVISHDRFYAARIFLSVFCK